jgi:sugar phosphate permease
VYSCTFACVKLLAYSLLLWLPFYLSEEYGLESVVIGSLASCLEVGAICGSLSIGYMTDKLTVRSPVVVPILALSIPLLVFIRYIPRSEFWLLYPVILLLGVSIVGSSHIISSAIAADLATNNELQGNLETLSTVSGIIDGCGGLGAAIGQVSVKAK